MFTGTLFHGILICLSILQAPTIPDRVSAKGGKPVSIGAHIDTRALSVGELASTALLVVRGKLVRMESHLSRINEIFGRPIN